MIYCSNLCTEIAQNMSPSDIVGETVVDEDGDEYIIYKRKIGDFVVCNLASVNLGRAVKDNVLRRVVRIMMRMLDNVIDVNNLPLLQATITNHRYRPVGLGTFGWHHILALLGIDWDSQESIDYADSLYEEIAFYAIEMSAELAEEKGSYKYYDGSEYQTGVYFDRKGYKTESSRFDWDGLKKKVMTTGIRNGYWGAVAPNASTALIAGSTQGIDPFYGAQCIYFEEKKDFKMPIVAPDLSIDTWNYYYRKNAHYVNQEVSILQNAKRQRHIDQAVSFNLYIKSDIKAKDLMQIHRTAWRNKLKTTYYTRGTANMVDDCDACQ
jgi:ribonucleoside-diphosphate reductase alpha chain